MSADSPNHLSSTSAEQTDQKESLSLTVEAPSDSAGASNSLAGVKQELQIVSQIIQQLELLVPDQPSEDIGSTQISTDQNPEQLRSRLLELSEQAKPLRETATIVISQTLPLLIDKIDRFYPHDADELAQFLGSVEQIVISLQSIRQHSRELQHLQREAREDEEALGAKLLAESGMASREQIDERIAKIQEEIAGHEDAFLGKTRKSRQIKVLQAEQRRLRSIGRQIDDTQITPGRLTTSETILFDMDEDIDREVRHTTQQLMDRTISAVAGRAEMLIREMDSKNQEGTLPLSPEEIILIENMIIQKKVRGEIERERENLSTRAQEEVANGGNNDYFQKNLAELDERIAHGLIEAIIARGEQMAAARRGEDVPHDADQVFYREFAHDLPYGVGQLTGQILRSLDGKQGVEEMVRFVAGSREATERRRSLQGYQDVLSKLGELSEQLNDDGRSLEKITHSLGVIEYGSIPESMRRLATEINPSIWQEFVETAAKEHFEPREISEANHVLLRTLLDAINKSSGSEGSRNHHLSYQLAELHTVEAAPYALLDMWYRTGYSGTSQKEGIAPFLSSLSDDQKAELAQRYGIGELIELVESDPDYASSYGGQDSEGNSRNNPTHEAINQQLMLLSSRLLQGEMSESQAFVLDIWASYGAKIDTEAIHVMLDTAEKTWDKSTVKIIIKLVEDQLIINKDPRAALSLLSNDEQLSPLVREQLPKLIADILPYIDLASPEGAELLTIVAPRMANQIEVEPPELELALKGIGEIESYMIGRLRHDLRDPAALKRLVEISRIPRSIEAINVLAIHGYEPKIDELEAYPFLAANIDSINDAIVALGQQNLGHNFYVYHPDPIEPQKRALEIVGGFVPSPEVVLKNIDEQTSSAPDVDPNFRDALYTLLRLSDPRLNNDELSAEQQARQKEQFGEALKLLHESTTQDGNLLKDLAANPMAKNVLSEIIRFAARSPEKANDIIRLEQSAPDLFNLMREGGPLFTNRLTILQDLFKNGDVLARAREIESIFTKNEPYWKQLFMFTETRLGDVLAAATSEYPVTNLIKIRLPLGERLTDLSQIQGFETRPISEMSVQQKRLAANLEDLSDEEVSAMPSIPFRRLSGVQKRLVYAQGIADAVERSRSEEHKRQADEKNRSKTALELTPGTYLHGSAVDVIQSVLLNGNLPTESLGENAGTDGFPFHVDFTDLQPDFLEGKETRAILQASLSGGYGAGGQHGIDGQVFYIYDRARTEWRSEQSYHADSRSHQGLELAGVPATEISGIALTNPEVSLDSARDAVLENGFYIPIFDLDGRLLFTPEQYDTIREDLNLSVPVPVWDNSFKTGEQLGSNPGGEFTVPTDKGPTRYYVKFESAEGADRLWNEHLANLLYRATGVEVPNTMVVSVEGSYGHASEILEREDSAEKPGIEDGFLIDCLLSNWDAVYNPENTIVVAGKTVRIDAGGSLLFRARGERKSDDLLTERVQELELGTNNERLGFGMRQKYPELTAEDVQNQAEAMRAGLTDESIDILVDSVRLSRSDRDTLKQLIKARRDYILSWAETQKDLL